MSETLALDPQFTLRHATRADVQSVADLINIIVATDITFPAHLKRETLALFWEMPGITPEKNSWLVFKDDTLIAYANATNPSPNHRLAYQELYVLPPYRRTSLPEFLLQTTYRHACGFASPQTTSIKLQSTFRNLNGWETPLMQKYSYIVSRQVWKLQMDLTLPFAAPVIPEGIALRPYDPIQDSLALHAALENIFAGHWNYTSMSYEQWLRITQHGGTYDPTLWHVALAGDQLVGFVTCDPTTPEDQEAGYIHLIGVQPEWREKGLGAALLRRAFQTFTARGFQRVLVHDEATQGHGFTHFYQLAGMHIVDKMTTYALDLLIQ